MILSLKTTEATALRDELARASGPELEAVKDKLDRALAPAVPEPIEGQTDIFEQLGEAA